MSYTHTLASRYGATPVTVTVTGLPSEAARAVADYAETLTQQLSLARIERDETRKAAYRLQAQRERQVSVTFTEAQRLEMCRTSEERNRPAAVEVYVSPITGGAALHWIDKSGKNASGWDPVSLEDRHSSAMSDDLHAAAGLILAKRGLNYVPGATWSGDRTRSRVPILPTRDYLKLQERRFGPVPVLQPVDTLAFQPTGDRGWWKVKGAPDGEPYWLTWTPALKGDQWTVWGAIPYEGLGLRPARLVARAGAVADLADLAAIVDGQ
ncbi:hypothetical protein [Streptomyces sp. NPDC001450]